MKIALIAPQSMLQLNTRTDVALVLPRMLHDPDTIKYFRDSRVYKILDNGVAEGDQYDFKTILNMAREIRADEVVIPDTLAQANATIRQAVETEALCIEFAEFNYMGVIQGYSIMDMLKCLAVFNDMPHVNVVGIPRITAEALGHRGARSDMVREVLRRYPGRFEIHCLGSTRFTFEPQVLSQYPQIRSMDTSLPIYLGMAGKDLGTIGRTTPARPKEFFDYDKPTTAQWAIIARNCRLYQLWCNPKTPESAMRDMWPEHDRDAVLS